jgi:hypothetical protein
MFLVLIAIKTMASRFVVADNDVLEEVETSSQNVNTRKRTNLLVGVFKKWEALIKEHRRRHCDIRGSRT